MKNPTRLKQIQEFYKTGLFQNKDTGAKTAFYANQIFEASQGRFTPFTVNDIHMRRQFGMIDPNKPEKNQESPTAIEYQFQNDLMRLLSTEVYNVNGVRKNIKSHQKSKLCCGDCKDMKEELILLTKVVMPQQKQ